MVELAIILPVLVLLLLVALDLGRVFFGWVGLANATRIGASYAASHPAAWGAPGSAVERAHYEAQILADANALNCTLPAIPAPAFPQGTDLGDPASVTLSCQFALLTPFVADILGGTITIRAESVFPIRAGIAGTVPVGTAPPTPAGSPSPSPSGTLCEIPSFVGTRVNDAQTTWAAAGFTTTASISRPPNGNYTITNQGPGVGGQMADCDTTSVTVYGQ